MNIKSISTKLFSGLGLGLLMQQAFAGNITDIRVTTLSADQKIVKIRFDRDVVLPNGFNLTAPARIALDFPRTHVKLAQPYLQYQDPLLKQISAAEDDTRSRVALDLNQAGQYTAEIKGNEVWVYLKNANSPVVMTSPAAAPVVRPPVVIVQQPVIIQKKVMTAPPPVAANLDFHKGVNNNAVIEFTLPDANPKVSVKRFADRLILTYPNAIIPLSEQKKLDVSDFNTPARMVSITRMGAGTQVTIVTHGSWDYQTSQTDSRQIITVSRKNDLAERGLGSVQPKKFSGGRVSLDFQDIDVRTILQILAKESGMNIVASDSVTGKMTLHLKDVPWDQALDLVMQARNLDMRKNGNIINIAPRAELLQKDKDILTAQNEITNLGPLSTRTYQLKYKSVEEFRTVLNLTTGTSGSSSTPNSNSILSARGSALIDPSTNTLIITDNPFVLEKFDKLIAQLDVPARQVMIEARLVLANEGFSRDLGVRFGAHKVSGGTSIGGGIGSNSSSGSSSTIANNDFSSPNINLPAAAATSAISIIRNTATAALALELTASQQENTSRTISSPRVLTQDRKQAVIEQGKEIPYQEASSSGATSTSFKKAVLGLTVTPQITPDGNVIMKLQINNDSVDLTCSNGGAPCISTQSVNTNAMVENGGTLIVGGVYLQADSNGESKVPVLGDIPYIGNLFKKRSVTRDRSELLVFITPRIVDDVNSTLRY